MLGCMKDTMNDTMDGEGQHNGAGACEYLPVAASRIAAGDD